MKGHTTKYCRSVKLRIACLYSDKQPNALPGGANANKNPAIVGFRIPRDEISVRHSIEHKAPVISIAISAAGHCDQRVAHKNIGASTDILKASV